MAYTIICPYCFKEMKDNEVHFRSELVNQGEQNIISDNYDDLADFQQRYRGKDKEEILSRYHEWEFFTETDDPIYESFWSNFNGTTEYNAVDEYLEVKAYRRRVINPGDLEHQKYLRRQKDNGYFIYDDQGMVAQIELKSGEKCNRRVCRHCHNPLPDNYGKNNVKFATIIGITGSGKTVYLSQLLQKMNVYSVKAGLSAIPAHTSVSNFLERNCVMENIPLPGSTPKTHFQQPLFYEMVKDDEEHGRTTNTLVLYDVAGEVFEDSTFVKRFAPFIEHTDGVVLLIDPMQFEVIRSIEPDSKKLSDPSKVLSVIHDIVSHEQKGQKCNIPFAICISKVDTQEVQSVLDVNLKNMLRADIQGIQDKNGFYMPLFNAEDYAPIGDELQKFIQINEIALAQQIKTNYSSYAYFAFTALGCDIREREQENGEKLRYPVGPILPKRIEEPMLWLFYKFKYIGKKGVLPGQICCPFCDSDATYPLEKEQSIRVKESFLKIKMKPVNRYCAVCGYKWEYIPD